MKVHFFSFTDGIKSTSYETELNLLDNGYSFKDLSIENTTLEFRIINDSHIEMIRKGAINSKIDFILNDKTNSLYHSDSLTFEFDVDTKYILIKEKSLTIEYDYYYKGDKIGKIKLGLLIK